MVRYLLLIAFCASNAFASAADSGRCPWKLPFTISIKAQGPYHETKDEQPTHGPAHHTVTDGYTQDEIRFTIDTVQWSLQGLRRHADLSIQNDTLRYYSFYSADNSNAGFKQQRIALVIAFVPGRDSIGSIALEERDSMGAIPLRDNEVDDNYSFDITGLTFDDSLIYPPSEAGEVLSFHHSHDDLTFTETRQSPEFGIFIHSSFDADTLDLSGIFHSTRAKANSEVRPAPQITRGSPRTEVIRRSERSVLLIPEDLVRYAPPNEIDIYSISGKLVQRRMCAAASNTIDLSNLPEGCYWLRIIDVTLRVLIVP